MVTRSELEYYLFVVVALTHNQICHGYHFLLLLRRLDISADFLLRLFALLALALTFGAWLPMSVRFLLLRRKVLMKSAYDIR